MKKINKKLNSIELNSPLYITGKYYLGINALQRTQCTYIVFILRYQFDITNRSISLIYSFLFNPNVHIWT